MNNLLRKANITRGVKGGSFVALKAMGGAFSWSESEIVGGGIVKYGSQVRDGHVGALRNIWTVTNQAPP